MTPVIIKRNILWQWSCKHKKYSYSSIRPLTSLQLITLCASELTTEKRHAQSQHQKYITMYTQTKRKNSTNTEHMFLGFHIRRQKNPYQDFRFYFSDRKFRLFEKCALLGYYTECSGNSTTTHCIIVQKSGVIINIVAEAWNQSSCFINVLLC